MPADENKVKQRIELDGEKEYKKALDDAYRTLRVLKSELKAETAELGKNATAQEKNAVKMKSLQKQIAEQEKVVKTCTKALEEAREKYSDNEEEIAKWEQKLNNARAALANMKNDLEGVGDGFKTMQQDANMATVASRSAAESIGSLADIGEAISDSIEGFFTGMLSTVKGAIAEIWTDVVDLAARSNNLVDLAGFWNTDVTTIQKYAGAVEAASAHLEDLSAIVTKINAGDAKKIAELTGVSEVNYKDQWEYAMAVMDAMSKMTKEERNAAGFEIFGGRQATKAFDLLNDWQTVLDNLDKFDAENGGFGLTEQELQDMSTLYDKINAVKASWQSLKDMATVKLFGSLSLDLTSNAQGIVDGFLAYFNAENDEERDAAIGQIEDNITEMFTRVKKAIQDGLALVDQIAEDMKGSEDPTVQTIGKLMGGLAGALEWFTGDNMNKVLWSLGALATFWIAGKGLQFASTVAELATNIKTLSLFHGLKNLGGLGTMGETVGKTAGESFLGVLKQGLPGILGAALIAERFNWAANQRKNHREEVRGTEEYLEKQTGSANNLLLDYILAQKELEGVDIVNAAPELAEKLTQRVADAYNALLASENGEEALKAYSDWRQENSYGNKDWIIPDYMEEEETVNLDERSAEAIAEAIQDWWDAQRNAENGLEDQGEAWRALDWMQEVLGDRFGDVYEDIILHLDQLDRDQQLGLDDIPADWWMHGDNQGEGITNENLSAFNALPDKMQKAVAKGVSGIRVEIDGQSAGRILAPYVSEYIAAMM